jgi:hypothetical protein
MNDGYSDTLELLGELRPCTPDRRAGLPCGAMGTVLDPLGPQDGRARRHRQLLSRH